MMLEQTGVSIVSHEKGGEAVPPSNQERRAAGITRCLCLALRPIEGLKRDCPVRFGNTETISY
jgi:hypothetical protein